MRVRDVLESMLDAVLPPRGRTMRTKRMTVENISLSPASHALLGTAITTLMEYQQKDVQDLVQSLKYDGGARAASLCAAVLAEYLAEELSSEKLFSAREILLVPVPLHSSRARERGFNQIELVLRSLPKEFRDGTRARLAPEVLVRSRATAPQTKRSRSERLSNVAGAFAVPHPERVKNRRVYLIDDVATTGATLVNAGNALRRAGATVTLLALARA